MPLVVAAVIFALLLFAPKMLNDGDTLWHVAAGNWMLQHHAIPHQDPFSFSAFGQPWVTHEWLAEILMAISFRAAGWSGIVILTAAAAAITGGLLTWHLQKFIRPVPSLLLLIMAIGLVAPSMLARPHILALPCLELWCAGIVLARLRAEAPSWALLPLMVLWANLHGSFMLGLMLPIPFMLEAFLDPNLDRRTTLKTWSGFIVLAWLAALITPHPIAGILFPFHLLGMKHLALIQEWQPAAFRGLQPLEVAILAALYAGLSGRIRLPPLRLMVLLGLIGMALAQVRNSQILGIVGPLILAAPLSAMAKTISAPAIDQRTRWSLYASAAAIAAAMLCLRLYDPVDRAKLGIDPAQAIAAVPADLRNKPVLNEYSFGGYLIFSGIRPYIDGRADLYGDHALDLSAKIGRGDPEALERELANRKIAWTVFPSRNLVVKLMDRMPGWQRLYSDQIATVHIRDPAPIGSTSISALSQCTLSALSHQTGMETCLRENRH